MGLKIVTKARSDLTSNSSEEGPDMLRREENFPAGNPIPGIGKIEEKSAFDVVVESKVRRDG
jgi:hypothetical protein